MSAPATKAEVLQRLAPRLQHADVPPFLFWTVDEWRAARSALVAACVATFRGARVAVRSATCDEDRPRSGRAGHYRSELDVAATPAALARAIDRVVAVYPRDGRAHHVLVQAMVRDVRRSGVVTTRDPASAAAYDVIELAVGARTDIVTSGRGATTRIAVHRSAPSAAVARTGLGAVVRAVRAVEAAYGDAPALEIELVERRDGTIAIVQARELALATGVGGPHDGRPIDRAVRDRRLDRGAHDRRLDRAAHDRRIDRALARQARLVERLGCARRGIAGSSTVLGLMPDWNPAELIGAHPAPLAAALFRVLITDRTWQEARTSMGYQPVPRTPLVRPIAGRPYVDVRASFNSFVPAGLAPRVRAALVDGWLARLRAHPELHDRVELDVAATVLHFDVVGLARSGRGLTRTERAAWLAALRGVTARAIDLSAAGSLPRALAALARPAVRSSGGGSTFSSTGEPFARGSNGAPPARSSSRVPDDDLSSTLTALDACRVAGARPFAVVARHAFMAESLLRSLVVRAALAPDRLVAFRRGLATVASRFTAEAAGVARGTIDPARLLDVYGHLRPGAFDVTSLPYALRAQAAILPVTVPLERGDPFALRASERAAIARLLAETELGCGVDDLLAWATAAIVGREDAKLAFTRGLSAILEDLAAWAAAQGLARAELALLTVANLRRGARRSRGDAGWLRARIAAADARRRRERELRLGPLLRDAGDLRIVYEPPVAPTFITTRTVVAPPVRIDGHTLDRGDVAGKIVCIESADPGFDWLFARGIGGLVTRFGGANSHMAVRCFELGVAAALGVGERIFERVCRAATVELRCGEGLLRDGLGMCEAVHPSQTEREDQTVGARPADRGSTMEHARYVEIDCAR